MRNHRYALINCPGRIPSTAGAILLIGGLVGAATLGRAGALLALLGRDDLLAPIAPIGTPLRAIAVALLVGYPIVLALDLLAESWTTASFASWLGKRVRGSLCLLWTAAVAAALALHLAGGGAAVAAVLGTLALTFSVGGLAVRWLERQPRSSLQPIARLVAAALVALGLLLVVVGQWGQVGALGPLDGLLVSATLVGAALVLFGAVRDVVHQHATTPQLFSRDSLARAMRQP